MDRLSYFKNRTALNRFWWFTLNDYLPELYANLSEEEFGLLIEWFDETERLHKMGECNVPLMSVLLGFVTGSGISAIVQCGHYAGYSTLLLGWALKRMGKQRALFSMDIDRPVTGFTQTWIDKAGLSEIVHLEVSDSSEPAMPAAAAAYFGRSAQAVFIDSSHEYQHTRKELALWLAALQPGGLIFLHDVSDQAQAYDGTRQGGVMKAMDEWNGAGRSIMLNRNTLQDFAARQVYQDGCGLGIIQKT